MKMTGAQTQMLKGIITNPDHPELQGTFKQGNFWIVTDGFSCFYFSKKPNLPNCQGVDKDLLQYLDIPVSAKTQKVPDIDFMVRIKNISNGNKRRPFPYELDKDVNLFVNPYYMLRIMKILPGAMRMFYSTRVKPVIFVGDDDNYALLNSIRHDGNSPYINHEGELINPNLGEEIIKEEDECNSIKTVMSM